MTKKKEESKPLRTFSEIVAEEKENKQKAQKIYNKDIQRTFEMLSHAMKTRTELLLGYATEFIKEDPSVENITSLQLAFQDVKSAIDSFETFVFSQEE